MASGDRNQQTQGASTPRQLFRFLAQNKRWWLIPILLVFGIVTLLAVLSRIGADPLRTNL